MYFNSIFQDIFLRIKGLFASGPVLSVNPYINLRYLENYTPQLFLYSDTDKLIPPDVSEQFNSNLL